MRNTRGITCNYKLSLVARKKENGLVTLGPHRLNRRSAATVRLVTCVFKVRFFLTSWLFSFTGYAGNAQK